MQASIFVCNILLKLQPNKYLQHIDHNPNTPVQRSQKRIGVTLLNLKMRGKKRTKLNDTISHFTSHGTNKIKENRN